MDFAATDRKRSLPAQRSICDTLVQAPTMNAVEIEAAVSDLAARPFDASEFPFQFLAAFDKKETTPKRLRKGDSNKSDVPGAILVVNNIHLATCPTGQTREMLERLTNLIAEPIAH